MPTLIVHSGSTKRLFPSEPQPFLVYRIGAGDSAFPNSINVNDAGRLNNIAEKLRDNYSSWIFSLNDSFLQGRMIHKDLSMFFLTDMSCKRTEMFETFQSICNLVLISEVVDKYSVEKIILLGVDRNFVDAGRSIFTNNYIVDVEIREASWGIYKATLSDIRYLVEVGITIGINFFSKNHRDSSRGETGRYYFSPFPKMTNFEGVDSKYAEMIKPEDGQVVSIITDGLHQHVPPWKYLGLKKLCDRYDLVLIDLYLTLKNLWAGIYWLCKSRRFFCLQLKTKYSFHGFDVTGYMRFELCQSMSRVTRLMVLFGAFERFAATYRIKELVYYLHEYSFGRMISAVMGFVSPNTSRIGFQHGPASWRKLLYFMASGEASISPPFLNNAPVPHQVIAEDEDSAEIYRHAGYVNVTVMEKIYRLKYLESVKPKYNSLRRLIAPGLHDGEALMWEVLPSIVNNPAVEFILKPHPLANNGYILLFKDIANLSVTDKLIEELLTEVSEVFVTYSSVGAEARSLGIKVHPINLPGIVSQSPLHDCLTNKK